MPAPSMDAITFVIPVRNGASHLDRCLASVHAASGHTPGAEVVVVDNGSTDESRTIAIRRGARVMDEPGLRVGACRNAGAAASHGIVLAFVDADNDISATWVAACARAFGDPLVGAAGLAYAAPEEGTWVQRTYDALRQRPGMTVDTEWLAAGNLAVRRSVFEQVGGFDEMLEACEDVALCRAIRAAGYRVVSEPGMRSVHYGDPATLSALFRGELWRGRDNLRVSLRAPLKLRDIPGVAFPMVGLIVLTLGLVGLVSAPWGGIPLLVASAAAFGAIAVLRAGLIVIRGRFREPRRWVQALAVAATYEAGRALSLVAGATHVTRARVTHHA